MTTEASSEQRALDAYWAAKTPEEERAAYAQMIQLGMARGHKVTIVLDFITARLVAGACAAVAELDDTDYNDSRALERASAVIRSAAMEAENAG